MRILKHGFVWMVLLAASYAAFAQTLSPSSLQGGNKGMNSGGSPADASDTSWNLESNYWRNNYASRPYYNNSHTYSMYEPAYRYGYDLYNGSPDKPFDQLDQSQLDTGWANVRGSSNLDWSDAQLATRDAYNRMYQRRNTTTSNTR